MLGRLGDLAAPDVGRGARNALCVASLVVALATFGCGPFGDDEEDPLPSNETAGAPQSEIELAKPPPRSGAYPPPNIAAVEPGELWSEIDSSEGGRRVLVTLKDPGEERGYFNGRVLIDRADFAQRKE